MMFSVVPIMTDDERSWQRAAALLHSADAAHMELLSDVLREKPHLIDQKYMVDPEQLPRTTTLLHHAVACQNLEAVTCLLELGASVTVTNFLQQTPLLLAVSEPVLKTACENTWVFSLVPRTSFMLEIVQVLLASDSPAYCFDRSGRCFLDYLPDTKEGHELRDQVAASLNDEPSSPSEKSSCVLSFSGF